jgi:hypothetical protein
VDTCPECGNHDLHVIAVDGGVVVECGLCGERFGQRRALTTLSDREEAALRGYAFEVWPLVRELQKLPGIAVDSATPGDPGAARCPAVRVALLSGRGLEQIENLVRLLLLAAGGLRLAWVIEVEAEHQLVFVLRPRPPLDCAVPALREAHLDLGVLAQELARNRRLQWWQRA